MVIFMARVQVRLCPTTPIPDKVKIEMKTRLQEILQCDNVDISTNVKALIQDTFAGVVLKFAILKGRPNCLKEGQIARVLGRKEGPLESNYVL